MRVVANANSDVASIIEMELSSLSKTGEDCSISPNDKYRDGDMDFWGNGGDTQEKLHDNEHGSPV